MRKNTNLEICCCQPGRRIIRRFSTARRERSLREVMRTRETEQARPDPRTTPYGFAPLQEMSRTPTPLQAPSDTSGSSSSIPIPPPLPAASGNNEKQHETGTPRRFWQRGDGQPRMPTGTFSTPPQVPDSTTSTPPAKAAATALQQANNSREHGIRLELQEIPERRSPTTG